MALLSDRDSLRWHAIAQRVDADVRRSLAPGVLVHGTLTGPALGRSLRAARAAAAQLAHTSKVVILTDVTAFYPSVTPSVAFKALTEAGAEAATAREAAGILDGWGSEGYA